MKLENLFGNVKKDAKRVGRGIGSGKGKTAGRGTKGQLSRTGKKIRPGFEGGQLPLAQRVPKKPGFKSLSPKAVTITLDKLNGIKAGSKINSAKLFEMGLISTLTEKFKIVANDKYDNSLVLDTLAISEGAKKIVEKTAKKTETIVETK
ncbi:MAG: 50S ribosomal protein L15 [bacterium]